MKISKLTLSILVAPMILGCNQVGSSKTDEPVLEFITLSGNYQTTFYVGNTFSYDGLVVTAHYDNDETKVVTPTSVSTPDLSTTGEKDVIVTYETVDKSYKITVLEAEQDPDYEGYMVLAFYNLDIQLNSNERYYLNPDIKDNDTIDVGSFPFTFSVDDDSLVNISNAGGIYSKKNKTGTCIVTCTCTENSNLTAKCVVNVVDVVVEKSFKLVDDYDSLKAGDVIVIAAPTYGKTASLDNLHMKLNPATSTFSSDYKSITSLGEGTAEFVLDGETENFTLEAQNGKYLAGTNQGKVTFINGEHGNIHWDLHASYDIEDGCVIENEVESIGYFMFNVSQNYFTTYYDNSILPGVMELPFIYKLS